MAISRIEATLFPDDVLRTHRVEEHSRRWLIDHIGEKPSVLQNATDITAPPGRLGPFMLECGTILQRLWDAPEELQEKVKAAFRESLEFDELARQRKARFGAIDWDNIGVGKGTAQTKEMRRFDVVLDERSRPVEGLDWADGFGKAPDSITRPVDDLRLRCPDEACEFFTPWDKTAARIMGTHVHQKHPEYKKAWKATLKEFKQRHGLAS